MAKYEIMLILDPKANEAVASKLINDVFGKGVEKFEKLQRSELAYSINKTMVAQYFLANVVSEPYEVREFTRKANIIKEVWRNLVINLESERGIDRQARVFKKPMQRKFQQGQFGDKFKRPFTPRDQRDFREKREFQPRDGKDFVPRRDFVRRPSGDRPFTGAGDRRPSDRPFTGAGDRRPSDRPFTGGDRRPSGDRPFTGSSDRKPSGDRSFDRSSYKPADKSSSTSTIRSANYPKPEVSEESKSEN